MGDTSASVYTEKWSTATLQVFLSAKMLASELVSLTHTVPLTGVQSPASVEEAPTKWMPASDVPVGSGILIVTGTEKFVLGEKSTVDAFGVKLDVLIGAAMSDALISATVKLILEVMAPAGKVASTLVAVFTESSTVSQGQVKRRSPRQRMMFNSTNEDSVCDG